MNKRHNMIPIAKPYLTKKEVEAARKVILSGWVAQGPKVQEFEKALAKYVGAKYACAVSNCTTALHLALLAVGVKSGDSVITVSHSFIATANCITYCGAQPVFVDIDLKTFNMSSGELQRCLEQKHKRFKAILVVHQMGMPCDLKGILLLARKYKIPVIEDAACALGSEISLNGKTWKKIGKPHGDIACFSFHPRKLITTGEGGMLTTKHAQYDKIFRLLRHQGMSVSDLARHQSKKIMIEKYPVIGFNYRLTDIQAAIGLEQLKKLPAILRKRRRLARIYQRELKNISWLQCPEQPKYARSNWQSFAVRILKSAPLGRNQLMRYLLKKGISTRPGIMNSHQEKAYARKARAVFSLKNSKLARDSVILLPLFTTMKDQEMKTVIKALKNV
ncbi:MAG: DegT/DnrJ/EryC1/StrS family aminotransferase [Candidatus Omnitrophota bacterium]